MSYEMKSANMGNGEYLTPQDDVLMEKITKSVGKLSPIYSDNEIAQEIEKIVQMEKKVQSCIGENIANLSSEETKLLDHLGSYIEEPFDIIETYFDGKHLDRLVRHQIESYNHFVNCQIQRTIQMFNPVKVHSENDYVAETDKYFLEIFISFVNFKLYPPQIHENNGATKTMLPQEAKIRNFTYASTMTVDINIQYIIRTTDSMDNPHGFFFYQ